MNGTYDLDITPNIDQIIDAINDHHSESKAHLQGLKQYQDALQNILNQYETNLKAIIVYHIWY